MDIEKSLYMAEFMKMREYLGTVDLYPVKNTLFTNLYDELRPKQVKEVEEIIEDIEEKTIHLIKKEDQPVFFPDLPALDKGGLDIDIEEDIKVVKVSEGIDALVEDDTKKIIRIDPAYVPKD
jgi:hypothetical protein